VVWAKRKETYQKRVREQIGELLEVIERENKAEQRVWGEGSGRTGRNGSGEINSEQLQKKIAEINQKLNEAKQPKDERKVERQALKKLSEIVYPAWRSMSSRLKRWTGVPVIRRPTRTPAACA